MKPAEDPTVRPADVPSPRQGETHPNVDELEDWILIPEGLAAEEDESISTHVRECGSCRVYRDQVLAAEKEVSDHLQTETGRNWREALLEQIASAGQDAGSKAAPAKRRKPEVPDGQPIQPVAAIGRTSVGGGSAAESGEYLKRKKRARAEKRAIGKDVTDIVQGSYPGDAIGVDGGTTNEAFASELGRDSAKPNRDRRVLKTNHRMIPQLVCQHSDRIQVLGVGGRYRPDRETYVGDEAISSIERLVYSVSVLGINGFNPPWLLTTTGVEDDIKKAYIQSSRDVILAFDSSKWLRYTGSKLLSLGDLFGPKYLLDPDGRTVHLVTTYPLMDWLGPGDSRARVLLSRERFVAGIKRLVGNGWKHIDASVRVAIVRVPDEEDAEPMAEWEDPESLESLPQQYFDALEERIREEKGLETDGTTVLLVRIQLVGDFLSSHTLRERPDWTNELVSMDRPAPTA